MKVCLLKELLLLELAHRALIDLDMPLKNNPEVLNEINEYRNNKLRAISKAMPRNCKYPNHDGACKAFCDCGCPNGMDICMND